MKKLIIYYSYSGNTKKVVQKIQEKLSCDVLELKPKTPFSTDYDEVVKEYQNNEKDKKVVEIEKVTIDLSLYDEIIVGTPVWWYSMTPVMRSFLNQYYLNGSKISAFATNAGWIGHTLQEFKQYCPNIVSELNVVFDGNTMTH